ncbi:hypothetical protein [Flavobacterium sp. 14A]|uniref:hypothetical protein n=1 Tax=Flavobacterium sp. 14A TaxID=2735896 RepID=UPI00156E655D|nr:hypothetical protein [Flavobacterium sp. 14A]NRT13645.1 hypothetical protein [Flavobacterium sp. 14A]
MNRTKKIRGHKKIQKRIQSWIEQNKTINIADFLANKYCFTHISFEPYFNISNNNSNIAEPKSKTRKKIILGLEEIYNNWKIELEKLNQPFFLKIYLFEPRISKSQVICAIGEEKIEYYESHFGVTHNSTRKSYFQNILSDEFSWKTSLDNDTYSEKVLLNPECYNETTLDAVHSRKLLKKLNKKYNKVEDKSWFGFEEDNETDYFFYVPKGILNIGEK